MIETLDAAVRLEWAAVLFLSVQGGVAGGIALLLSRALPRLSPAQRSAILLVGLAGFVVPFRALLPVVAAPRRVELVHGSVAGIDALALALVAVHAAGAALALAALIRQRLDLSRVLRAARPVAPAVAAWARDARRRAKPRVVESDEVGVPFAARPLAPVVVLPARLIRGMELEQVAQVVRHESQHIRHGDLWINLAAALIRAVFWFHPVARVLARELVHVREELCDDAVVRAGCDPAAYGATLVNAAALISSAPEQGYHAALHGAEFDRLAGRLRRLARAGAAPSRLGPRRVAVAALAVALVAGPIVLVPDVRVERPAEQGYPGHDGHRTTHRALHRG